MSYTNISVSLINEIMENISHSPRMDTSGNIDVMMTLHSLIASVGIVANITVVIAFMNHRKLRRKIPNIFIINQVSNVDFVSPSKRSQDLNNVDMIPYSHTCALFMLIN